MKIKGLWFFGISGSGKSFLSKFLKKKIKNSILLDGDDVRKFISFDLSYSIYDRIIQTKRMLGFAEIFIKNRLFPIISTVYLNKKVYLNAKKIGILVVKVEREKNKTNLKLKNKKNVVGIDITLPKFKCLVIKNISEKSKKKFFEQIKKIITF
jgi:transposase|tara:strand:- start:252 stop:710 length:459 start_codon:yes stop_codon:yes gene_type:complete